ncbi:UNVERIFIED_CONTAM: putative calcium-binding protein CML44 [Sesamum angustifolium]|uniref:Calcium-binding protein CML44 n=1 Tax=Sesamum angustifolium TaxID=2727405 RepID=A0AAW2L4X9_9LAMI
MSPLNTLHLHRIFDKLDRDKDGHVSIDELMSLLESTGVGAKRDELELLVGRKTLDLVDFLFFYETLIVKEKVELKIALTRLGLWEEHCGQDCQRMIEVYDTNSDGLLDFEEFKAMMLVDD